MSNSDTSQFIRKKVKDNSFTLGIGALVTVLVTVVAVVVYIMRMEGSIKENKTAIGHLGEHDSAIEKRLDNLER